MVRIAGKKRDRAVLLIRARQRDEIKAGCLEKCRRGGIKFFFDMFLWTYDPRPERKPNHFPFLLYGFQEETIDWIEERYKHNEDGLVDKSRDLGVTWMFLGWLLFHWMFDSSFNALVGSRKEDLVDNFDMDSLFGRLEYMVRRLPEWMRPEGFEMDKHRNKMSLVNPVNNNSILGESSNLNFARQGRYSVIMLDEFVFWEEAYPVWTGTADASPVRFPISSIKGKNNKFSDLRFGGKIKVKTIHWKLHPLKDDLWYKKEVLRRSPEEIAQELDIDYEASGGGKFLDKYAIYKDKIEVAYFKIPEDWFIFGGLDYGTRNPSAFYWYAIDFKGKIWVCWEFYKPSNYIELCAVVRNSGYYREDSVIYADRSLWQEDQLRETASGPAICSIASLMADLKDANGKTIGLNLTASGGRDLDCRDLLQSMWTPEKCDFVIMDNCPKMRWEFENLRWVDMSEKLAYKQDLKEKLMDKNNHSFDSAKYMLMNRPANPMRTVVLTQGSRLEEKVKMYNKKMAAVSNRKKTMDVHLGSEF